MSPVELLCFACIALAVLSKMIDIFIDWIENIMLKINFLPDQIENTLKFIFIGALGYVFCWQANYSFFDYLVVIKFNYVWEGWLATALILRGGSKFVEIIFKMINEKIPSFIRFGGSYSYYGTNYSSEESNSESTITSEYHV
ncbi:MAG: hypothetical protein PHO58_05715 [Bacilli bacterium]|nr:hypothetical protein [Bacilli bacterium]